MTIPPWKLELQPASFNGIVFHVDVSARSGGRRNAMHEFPKKEIPYDEDMGRRARGFIVMGYVIGPFFKEQRDALTDELDRETNGVLILPTMTDEQIVVCDRFVCTERRERGGYAEFEMNFVEAGEDPALLVTSDTQTGVNNAANSATGGPSFLDSTNTFIGSSDITSLT